MKIKQIVPAPPGWRFIRYDFDEDGGSLRIRARFFPAAFFALVRDPGAADDDRDADVLVPSGETPYRREYSLVGPDVDEETIRGIVAHDARPLAAHLWSVPLGVHDGERRPIVVVMPNGSALNTIEPADET